MGASMLGYRQIRNPVISLEFNLIGNVNHRLI